MGVGGEWQNSRSQPVRLGNPHGLRARLLRRGLARTPRFTEVTALLRAAFGFPGGRGPGRPPILATRRLPDGSLSERTTGLDE
jgi:hypothetical protein